MVLLTEVSTLVLADAPTERRLGISAVANGDYRNAVNFFQMALALSDNDQEGWAENAVDLAEAKLRSGDLAGAKEMLAEFRRRLPAHSVGILPGEIMIAERKYAEAEKFFQNLLDSAVEPEQNCKTRYALAMSRIFQKKFAVALTDLEKLEQENADLPSWAARAHLARIYALLASGDLKSAEALLKLGRFRGEQPESYRHLELALLLKEQKFDEFYHQWLEISESASDKPNKLLYDLALSGSHQATEEGKRNAARRLLSDSFHLSGTDLERRNALRELINVEAKDAPEQAADTIKRYLEYYPEADDRVELLLRGARVLATVKSYDRSFELFTLVTGDKRVPLEQRLEIAREAAQAAVVAGQTKFAHTMFQYLIEQAETPEQKLDGNFRYGEFWFREKNYKEAVEHLKLVASSNSEHAEVARYRLLQALVELKQYLEAEPVAEALRGSKDPLHVTCAEFYRALLLEKAGRSVEARSGYQKFLVENPNSEYAPRAQFSVAELALELRDYPVAAEVFLEFARNNPKSPSAPIALYQAVLSNYFAKNLEGTQRSIEILEKSYPNSPVVVASHLQLADYLIRDGNYVEAHRQLSDVEKINASQNPEVASELLYDQAKLAILEQKRDSALSFLDQLLKQYPSSAFGADAALMAGNIKADQGDYHGALRYYDRALTLRPAGGNAELTRGRIADARYNIYATTLDRSDLDQATSIYCELADGSDNPQIMLQSLYKYGQCRELMDGRDEALRAYEKLLYLARDLQKRGIAPDPVWTSRGAYQAVLLNLKVGSPACAMQAFRDIRLYEEMKLPDSGDDFVRIKQEIRQRYNFEEK